MLQPTTTFARHDVSRYHDKTTLCMHEWKQHFLQTQ